MNDKFPYRYIIFVNAAKVNVGNVHAENWDFDEGGGNTFGVMWYSSDGNEPATHSGCNTLANADMSDGILTAMGSIPFYKMYQLLNSGTIQRRDGNSWTTIAASGDFNAVVLADAGLQVIESEII